MNTNETHTGPKTNSMAAISTYVVLSIVIFIYGFIKIDEKLLAKALLFLGGVLLFTLLEYLFHRFVYHSGDDYLNQENWQYKVHGVHHDHPRDKDLLAMPIPLALLLSAIFFGIFYAIMGMNTFFFWPGFFIGYASYLFVHYIVHTSRPPNNAFKILWTHHHLHHYVYDNKAYGVSSPLWDVIFRTMPPKNQRIPRQKNRK